MFTTRGRALVDVPILNKLNPPPQHTLQQHIHRDRDSGVDLGALKAKLVVPSKAGGRNKEGPIAQRKTYVA